MVYPNKKRNFSHYLDQDQDQDQDQQQLQKSASVSFLLTGLGAVLSSPRSLSYIESHLRLPIRDEVERHVENFFNRPRSSPSVGQACERSGENEVFGNGSRRVELKLCFVNKIPSIIFTNNPIEAENSQPLQVALWDISTNSYYNIEGTNPLSSAKIELVVLDGEFGSAQGDQDPEIHWSVAEFNKSIVTQTKGARPLLVGNDKTTRLKNGVAFVNDLSFTVNSSRNRTKMIELGARIIEPEILNNYQRIGEAVSNRFRVKDHRGEAIKKNHPPKGEDKVNRLEGIGKDRETRLATKGIHTVDDFVKALQKDHASLRKLLGGLGRRLSDKKWNEMVKHVSEYVPLIPTFDPIMNLTSYNNNNYNEVGDILFDQIDDHLTFEGLCSPLLPHLGEASTSNTHNYEVENFNTFDQHFKGPWQRT